MNPNTLAIPAVTLLPILIGTILRYVGIFIEKPKELRNRIDLLEKSKTEMLAVKLTAVLSHLRRIIDTDELLRGDGKETVDLVGDYTNLLNRIFKINHKLGVCAVETRMR